MRPLLTCWALFALAAADRPSLPPLHLPEVLADVEARHPALRAAEAKQQAAAAKQRAARGAWDPQLTGKGTYIAAGAYPYRLVDAQVSQATPLWGAQVIAGYRRQAGPLPVYKGGLATGREGELYAGVALPLLKGGAIDGRRAALPLSDRALDVATCDRHGKLLSLRRDATAAYWAWVAAAQQRRVDLGLLTLAEVRDGALALMVEQGEVPRIERTENQRAILQRRERLLLAERKLQAGAIKLSMYWRDGGGEPRLAEDGRAPGAFPAPHPPTLALAADIDFARRQRPELGRLLAQRGAADVALRLGRNALQPKLDLTVGGHKELGGGYKAPAALELGAQFALPLTLRAARGSWHAAAADRARVALELAYARDQVALEVRDVHSLLANAWARQEVIGHEVVVAREVEEAERERFSLGESSLLIVNLREQASADAAKRLIDCLADYWSAWGTYQAVLAQAP